MGNGVAAGTAPLSGVPASGGVAVGRVHLIRSTRSEPREVAAAAVPAEQERLRSAAARAAADLTALARRLDAGGAIAESGIFEAQALMCVDPALLDVAATRVATRSIDAATAVRAVADEIAAELRAIGDELFATRAADVIDVASRIGRILDGTTAPTLDGPAIVIADDLAPSTTATLPRALLLGLAVEGGSPTAHVAILARAYGIPAIVGVRGLVAAAQHAQWLAIDGTTGELVIEPDEAARADFAARQARAASAATEDPTGPVVTPDGVTVTLLANIGRPEEAAPARAAGADGVGLFRTEFLFLERATPPTEDEQERAYRTVLEAFAPLPVTVRLLDVGGDKDLPYLHLAREANPFLGQRGIRLAAVRRDLFRTQLRALARASGAGRLKVMAPMIADHADVADLRDLWSESTTGLPHASVEIGAMIEVPSAALLADDLLGEVDFASLGTNDLLQYVLAADRGDPALSRFHDALHPAHLRLIDQVARAAARTGRSLSVCGEMAADPLGAALLVGLGIRELSMVPAAMPAIRAMLRANPHAMLVKLAADALREPTAAAVRERARVIAREGASEGM
jgi:phosphoenolpyruvate-protein phosphotransferase